MRRDREHDEGRQKDVEGPKAQDGGRGIELDN